MIGHSSASRQRALLFLLVSIWPADCVLQGKGWSKHLSKRYPTKAAGVPVLLTVVDKHFASTVLPVFITSVLALPGHLEERLTVVATSKEANAFCQSVHADCFLDDRTFSHEHVNFTGSKAYHEGLKQPLLKKSVKRTRVTLQKTWGKVSFPGILGMACAWTSLTAAIIGKREAFIYSRSIFESHKQIRV